MAVAPDATLQRKAAKGLLTLARHQARNGQIPKFVDTAADEADFWYLGCIDATLWWLIAIALLDRHPSAAAPPTPRRQRRPRARLAFVPGAPALPPAASRTRRATGPTSCPLGLRALHQRAVVRREAAVPAARRRRNAPQLQPAVPPYGAAPAEYRRARLLIHYVRHRARQRGLYFSFVNFSYCGDEGDVFGNLLAILAGLADEAATHRIVHAVMHAKANEPYPVRVVCAPIQETSVFWRPYMSRHRQNFIWQYQTAASGRSSGRSG